MEGFISKFKNIPSFTFTVTVLESLPIITHLRSSTIRAKTRDSNIVLANKIKSFSHKKSSETTFLRNMNKYHHQLHSFFFSKNFCLPLIAKRWAEYEVEQM